MIESSLETYQHVVAEIAKEIVKSMKLSDKGFETIDDLINREFDEAFYVDLNILDKAENLLNEFLDCAKALDVDQVNGAANDNLLFFCELEEKDNYLIGVLMKLERRMQLNKLLDIERSPTQIDYGMHALDAKDLREVRLGMNPDNDFNLFQAFIHSLELGKNIHDLEIMFETRPMGEKFDALGHRVEFDCETMELANIQLEQELKTGMSL